ncbi:MAG: hypothetical protein A2X23_00875 [Chloroflexi bacterium GWC2_73_18]|nr:MAG: hypothetical protein A2X23_00875 [Chloroflexi bacterium GWC2_73_18]
MQRSPGNRQLAVPATRFVRPSRRTRERHLGLHRLLPGPVPAAAARLAESQRRALVACLRTGAGGARPAPRRPVVCGRLRPSFRITWAPAERAVRWRA